MTTTDELTEALSVHAATQRELAVGLRKRAAQLREQAKRYCAFHSGPSMELHRKQALEGASSEARQLEAQAARSELRATRAEESPPKLLWHEWVENSDVEFLNRFGGRRLIALTRRVEGSIVAE